MSPSFSLFFSLLFFFFNDTATTEIYTLSLHDALPIYQGAGDGDPRPGRPREMEPRADRRHLGPGIEHVCHAVPREHFAVPVGKELGVPQLDRVPKFLRQLRKEAIEPLGPLRVAQEIRAPHRLELEYEADRLPVQHTLVARQHAVEKQARDR